MIGVFKIPQFTIAVMIKSVFEINSLPDVYIFVSKPFKHFCTIAVYRITLLFLLKIIRYSLFPSHDNLRSLSVSPLSDLFTMH